MNRVRSALALPNLTVLALIGCFLALPVPALAQTGIALLLGRPSIPSGAFTLGIVVLDTPAPEGGVVVLLTSSSPEVASVPASVSVPAGQVFASFLVATTPVPTTTPVEIMATADSVTCTLGLVLWGTGAQQPD